MLCPYCRKPTCPDCGRCPGAGHKADCPSAAAAAIRARLARQALTDMQRRYIALLLERTGM